MFTKVKLWWYKGRLSNLQDSLEELESTKCFISEFFCGKTMYPIRLQQRNKEINRVLQEINRVKETIGKLEVD